jgi:predicted helicase
MVRCGAEGPWSCPAHRLRGLSQHQSFQNFANRSGAKAVYRAVVTELMKAFQKALIHDLDADGFADMYAQTIAYGLLSARIADPEKKTADDFAAHMRTNPFLRELMETFLKVGGRRGKAGGPGIDFDELGVSEVVELLDDANMEAVVRDFGDRNPEEDPVIHFYELFLKEYDAKKRIQRGVFYTPRPVVSYIVRSVDELLRTELGLEDGLADTSTWGEMAKRHKDLKIPDAVPLTQAFVQILDPATGTGTFLTEIIDLIHKTLVAKWKAQGHGEQKIEVLWNDYVPKHLLPRLHGYELMMAPYAITHLKIGLKFHETGYRFGSDERARIFLTNALEPASDKQLTLDFLPALAHEAHAVNEIKRKQRFTLVIGNPPYSVNSANKNSPIDRQLIEYKRGLTGERNLKPLNDDYVKFIRFAHMSLEQTKLGLLGMITNHSYTTARLFRAMRLSLLRCFQIVRFLDLRGDMGRDPQMAEDENVFDIQQGVGITILCLTASSKNAALAASRCEVKGRREDKYSWLGRHSSNTTPWIVVSPQPPLYGFGEVQHDINLEYETFLPVNRVFNMGNVGYQTHRDDFVIDFTPEKVISRIASFKHSHPQEMQLSERFGIQSNRDWSLLLAHTALVQDAKWRRRVKPTLYRPFDFRYIAYAPYLIDYDRSDLMRHMKRDNRGLLVSKVFDEHEFTSVLATNLMVESKVADRTRGSHLFPLRLVTAKAQMRLETTGETEWMTNLSDEMVAWLKGRLGVTVCVSDSSVGPGKVSDRDVFGYIYGVLHSPGYRSRYAEFLKADFPRLPPPGSLKLFRELVPPGTELVALHLMESPKLDDFVTTYTGPENPQVERVGWSDNTVWLDAAATKKGQPVEPGSIGFHGVPEQVWNFHIGGYHVCEKWLKDRKGRKLSKDDIAQYQKIVVALAETIRLMKEIDEVIEAHGGWPGAFQPVASADTAAAPRASATALPASS